MTPIERFEYYKTQTKLAFLQMVEEQKKDHKTNILNIRSAQDTYDYFETQRNKAFMECPIGTVRI